MTSIIKVDNIQNASGTSALSIDSSGYVFTKQPIIAKARKTNANVSATGTIIWNAEDIDTASAYDTSTGVFTCPVDGYYEVSYHFLFRPGSATNSISTSVRLNGNKLYSGAGTNHYCRHPASVEVTVSVREIIECNATDEISVKVEAISGGDMYGGTSYHNLFMVRFVG